MTWQALERATGWRSAWPASCLCAGTNPQRADSFVTSDPKRVLIVVENDAPLLALGDYLTFRGLRVDGAVGFDDGRALVRHLLYDAVVVAPSGEALGPAYALVQDLREHHAPARVFALVTDASLVEPARATLGADGVEDRSLPAGRLARALNAAIRASLCKP